MATSKSCSEAGGNLPSKRRSSDGRALASCKTYYKDQYAVSVRKKGTKAYKKLYVGWKSKKSALALKTQFLSKNKGYEGRIIPRAKGVVKGQSASGGLDCQMISKKLAECKVISKGLYTVLKKSKGAKSFKRAFIGYKTKAEAEAYKKNFLSRNKGYEARLQPKITGKKTAGCKTLGKQLAGCKNKSKTPTKRKSTTTAKRKSGASGGGMKMQRVKDGRVLFTTRLKKLTKGEQGK
jgi:hypothetical protein